MHPKIIVLTTLGGMRSRICGSAGTSERLRRSENRSQGSTSSKAISTPSWITIGTQPTSTACKRHAFRLTQKQCGILFIYSLSCKKRNRSHTQTHDKNNTSG